MLFMVIPVLQKKWGFDRTVQEGPVPVKAGWRSSRFADTCFL